MRVLGVDPGTIKMGLGVVDSISGDLMSPYHGVIAPRRKDPLENRLAHLFEATKKVIEETQPDVIAIEEPFVSKNPKTGIAIGQAQAVVFIAGAQKDIPVFRYAPQEV
ncbi:MAG TPA: crossover junction endodeoxyribonuclease RuvC, partial [Dehalococcoidia bacterium]|nr:crossover junction endodeoxyribonuclease RuvC [Dehalococcoidia bacterium]